MIGNGGGNMADREHREIMAKLQEIEAKIKKVEGKIDQITYDLQQIKTLVMSQ
jgi:tetrahydromethanopterin S-methyltransferase subunit G